MNISYSIWRWPEPGQHRDIHHHQGIVSIAPSCVQGAAFVGRCDMHVADMYPACVVHKCCTSVEHVLYTSCACEQHALDLSCTYGAHALYLHSIWLVGVMLLCSAHPVHEATQLVSTPLGSRPCTHRTPYGVHRTPYLTR